MLSYLRRLATTGFAYTAASVFSKVIAVLLLPIYTALLEWMEDNHFTLLGYREYRLKRGKARDLLEPVHDTGLRHAHEDLAPTSRFSATRTAYQELRKPVTIPGGPPLAT